MCTIPYYYLYTSIQPLNRPYFPHSAFVKVTTVELRNPATLKNISMTDLYIFAVFIITIIIFLESRQMVVMWSSQKSVISVH